MFRMMAGQLSKLFIIVPLVTEGIPLLIILVITMGRWQEWKTFMFRSFIFVKLTHLHPSAAWWSSYGDGVVTEMGCTRARPPVPEAGGIYTAMQIHLSN